MSQDGSLYLSSNLKLTGEENYSTWKNSIINLALIHDLSDHFHPLAPEPPAKINIFDKKLKAEDIEEYKAWAKKDAKMKLIITGNMSMSLVRQVENLESAKSMWKALRNQFEGSGIVLYMQAAAKFSSMRCSDYTKLDDFILAYRQTMETLAQFKMKVRDPDAVIFFVEKVKDDYPMWAMNMRTRLRSLKEIEDIKISLLDEFIRDLKDESRENSNNKRVQMVMYQ